MAAQNHLEALLNRGIGVNHLKGTHLLLHSRGASG